MDDSKHSSESLGFLKTKGTSSFLKPVETGRHKYQSRAFTFLMMALKKAAELYGKDREDLSVKERHLSGRELLEGIRLLGLEMFGPLAELVFNQWGIHRTEDWGEIVFFLVDAGFLKKTERDRRQDFAGGYDFSVAFRPPDYWNDIDIAPVTLPDWDSEDSSPEGTTSGEGGEA